MKPSFEINKIIELLSKHHVNSYIKKDQLKNLFQKQQNLNFNGISLPQNHNISTFKNINDYLHQSEKRSILKVSEYSISLVFGAIHHSYLIDNMETIEPYLINLKLIKIIRAYEFVFGKALNSYNKASNLKGKKHVLTQASKEDFMFGKFIRDEIAKLLDGSKELINNFYCLLFFNFYTSFNSFKKGKVENDSVKTISLFVLQVLPYVIGMYRFGEYSSRLRDDAFYLYDHKTFLGIKNSIDKIIIDKNFISNVTRDLNGIIGNLSKKYKIEASIKKREKGVFSAYLKSKTYACEINELWDLIAFRIIVKSDEEKHCFDILSQLQSRYKRWDHPKGYFDYISNSKENGYQSIHLIVEAPSGQLVEIQIRTAIMHYLAELGSASHHNYKLTLKEKSKNVENKNRPIVQNKNDPLVKKGKNIIEYHLKKRNLDLDDYYEHLRHGLKHIPIDHYYKGIALKKYNPIQIAETIFVSKSKKKK